MAHDHALDATLAEVRQLTYAGRTGDAISRLQQARQTVEPGGAADLARLALEEGGIRALENFQGSGSFDETFEVLEMGREQAELSGDPELIADAHDKLGMALYYQALATGGDFGPALAELEPALALRRDLDDNRALAESLFHVGLIHQNSGNWDAARDYYQRAIEIAEPGGHALEISYAVRHLGMYYQTTGDLEAAAAYYRRSLELREQIDFLIFLPFSHIQLGDALVELGDLESARQHFTTAYEIAVQINSPSQTIFALIMLAELAERGNQRDAARRYFERALQAANAAGFERGRARAVAGIERLAR